MNNQLKRLYQSVILKNNNDPIGFEKRVDPVQTVEAYNQICGDRFKLFFDVENDKITQLSFHGFGCAISKAATSILVKHLDGQSPEKAKQIVAAYFEVLEKGEEQTENIEEDFLAFAAAKEFPGRAKCATLSWEAMRDFLEKGDFAGAK